MGTDKTAPSIDVAKKLAGALHISLDFLAGLDHPLYIDDPEMARLLKGYEKLPEEDKSLIKKMIEAFSLYSKTEGAQKSLAH